MASITPDEPDGYAMEIREGLRALVEGQGGRMAVKQMRNGDLRTYSKDHLILYASYITMLSVRRQERLTNDMHAGSLRMEKQSKRMICLTWAITVLTVAVVILTVVLVCRG